MSIPVAKTGGGETLIIEKKKKKTRNMGKVESAEQR